MEIATRLGMNMTSEQLDFAEDFTRPVLSFSDPGSGKTSAAIVGLLTAQLSHKIKGERILAMSYSRAATGELKNRHAKACATLRMPSSVEFRTVDALCRSILLANPDAFNCLSLEIREELTLDQLGDLLLAYSDKNGLGLNQNNIRSFSRAVTTFNTALIFDPEHIQSRSEFLEVGMRLENFQQLRQVLFSIHLNNEMIPIGDILLYTLALFERKPIISQQLQEKYDILLIDEMQDMSLLKLVILSKVCNTLIAIGDNKQKIYDFAGASDNIVGEFLQLQPNAKIANLTLSFRCKSEIVEFSKTIIKPNKMGEDKFTPHAEGGTVVIKKDLNIQKAVNRIRNNMDANRGFLLDDTMFLARNNDSLVSVCEVLYQAGVPFQAPKYMAVNNLPVIKDFISIIFMARYPSDPKFTSNLHLLIEEFRERSIHDSRRNPITQIQQANPGLSLFDIKYAYLDPDNASDVLLLLTTLKEMLDSNASITDMIETIIPVYEDYYLDNEGWKLARPAQEYITMATPALRGKTFDQFLADEGAKSKYNDECMRRLYGVKCYTFHGSKGLEADHIYLLGVDEGIIPNAKIMERKRKLGSELSIAKDLRSERCLAFVAATRAKEALYIGYLGELSPLFDGEGGDKAFGYFDDLYESENSKIFDDFECYKQFIKEV